MTKNEAGEALALAATVERLDKELTAQRARLAALEAIRKGAVVLYHAPDGDWPALVVSSKVVRAGFPPRHLLYVFFARAPRYVYDATEGDGPEQFGGRCRDEP